MRPFISGHVADSMAAEVIALLHGLLTAPVSLTAQSWAAAVEKVSLTQGFMQDQIITSHTCFGGHVDVSC